MNAPRIQEPRTPRQVEKQRRKALAKERTMSRAGWRRDQAFAYLDQARAAAWRFAGARFARHIHRGDALEALGLAGWSAREGARIPGAPPTEERNDPAELDYMMECAMDWSDDDGVPYIVHYGTHRDGRRVVCTTPQSLYAGDDDDIIATVAPATLNRHAA